MPRIEGFDIQAIIKNLIVALTVSIVMLNLGAALGLLSGRGVFAGMLSAGCISIITSLLSGAKVQGSGLTAPMSAVTAVIIAKASEQILAVYPDMHIGLFVNVILIEMGILVLLAGALRLGRFIRLVPNLVVAGFMSGIALMIWIIQVEILFGIGRDPLEGKLILNLGVFGLTLLICMALPKYLNASSFTALKFIPAPLIALVFVSFAAYMVNLDVAFLTIENTIEDFAAFKALVGEQLPIHVPADLWIKALPYAIQLAALCYIDTLLTALVITKLRKIDGKYSRDLMAQGVSNACLSIFGGVPGAQSTVPSVLMVKEGATQRLCGVFAGVIVIAGTFMFVDLLNFIPKAVFAAILFKVGYDIFDFPTLFGYFRTLKKKYKKRPHRVLGHREMGLFAGTALFTSLVDLIAAVGLFTALFHLISRKKVKDRVISDYTPKK